jgi:hypothetical protein
VETPEIGIAFLGGHRVGMTKIPQKVILTATHSGKRPVGTFTEEIERPECEEIEREMKWINAGYHRKEMVFKIKYSCGRCQGILYTGITKVVEDD